MSLWGEIFLGVIALATLTMAIGQVALFVAAGRLAKRVGRLADVVEHEIKPLFAQVNAIARDASRAASLAAAQVERADQVFGDLLGRLETTLNILQGVVALPARQGPALLAAVRAMMGVVRGRVGRRGGRPDDEDALFI